MCGEPRLERADPRRRLRQPVLEARRAGFVGEERRVAALARALGAEDEQVGAGEHRPRRGVRDPVRGRRGERVGHRHALEAELLPQQPVDDRARERGRPLRAVELRIDRGRDHHELHAGLDRGLEREQSLVELPRGGPDHDPPVVGVPAREAEAGEVLRGRRDPVRLQAADEGSGHLGVPGAGVREGARAEEVARRARRVDDRCEVDVDPDRAERRRRAGGLGVRDGGLDMSAGASVGGAQARRRTIPPSWSTAIRSGSPRVQAACCSSAVTVAAVWRVSQPLPRSTTPPIFPLRIRVRNLRFGGAVSVPMMVSAVSENPVAEWVGVAGRE